MKQYFSVDSASLASLFILLLLLAVDPSKTRAQAKTRKLPAPLNHPSVNAFAPYISADGNAVVFVSDNAEDNLLTPFYSFRDGGDWSDPKEFPKTIYTRLAFARGFSLSADGKKLFFTTLKSPSAGGFDIWTSDWKGAAWSEPQNMNVPVNSRAHEACPSISADGTAFYFMRCEKMDQNGAGGCRLLVAKKKNNGAWDEPVELPGHINTGNSQVPRIMADGETLIFSSDKFGGKGGMDLFVTRLVNGEWAAPTPLAFANTEKDDQFVSVAALGRYLVKDAMGSRRSELTEFLIPDELRPKGMMKLEGTIKGPDGKPVAAYITIMDVVDNKRFYSGKPYADGSFFVYITEGSRYELSVDPEQNNVTYFSEAYDLTSDRIPQIRKVDVVLKPLAPGDEIAFDDVGFRPFSDEVDASPASADMKRFIRLVKGNPDLKFEMQVMLDGYKEDSVQSDPDLTEVIYDSLYATYDDIDTLGQLYQRDTVLVRATYHNDRTWRQAESLVRYFVLQGIDAGQLGAFGNAIPATVPEERKLTVKAFVRPKND